MYNFLTYVYIIKPTANIKVSFILYMNAMLFTSQCYILYCMFYKYNLL